MARNREYKIIILLPLSFLLFFSACEKTVEEDVVQPVEMMVGQKSAAMTQAAVANLQNVRSALLRYQAVSPGSEFPGDTDIFDYATLRQTLSEAGLPQDMSELMWDPAYGVDYRSDGSSFTLEVRALSGETITATEGGVARN